jgi:hypothetical protein
MTDNVTYIEALKIIVSVWQILIGAAVALVAVILAGYTSRQTLIKDRKLTEEAKLTGAIRGLNAEVGAIIEFASRPWNSRMLTMPDDMWRNHMSELYDLPEDTQTKLVEFYLEVAQLNSIVNTDLRKVPRGGGYLDNAYKDQCVVVVTKGKELKPLLDDYLSKAGQKSARKRKPKQRGNKGQS